MSDQSVAAIARELARAIAVRKQMMECHDSHVLALQVQLLAEVAAEMAVKKSSQ